MKPVEGTGGWVLFGGFLRQMRLSRGLSQNRLAQLLDCDRIYVWRLEKGLRKPSRIFLHNLIQTCDLSPTEISEIQFFKDLRDAEHMGVLQGDNDIADRPTTT